LLVVALEALVTLEQTKVVQMVVVLLVVEDLFFILLVL
jgi:hypothetical protein